MADDEPSVPDESITYVRKVEYIDSMAEDVKLIRFKGDAKTIDVGVTDDVMVEFAEVAEQVFDDIHADMDEMRDIMDRRWGNDE